MAEQNAAAKEATASTAIPSGPKPIMFYGVILLNIIFLLGIGLIVYLGKKKQAAEPTLQSVISGEAKSRAKAASHRDQFIGTLVPMETFLVNLAGSRGTRLLKVNMEFEVDNPKVQREIEQIKPRLRDIIIILLSSKTYQQISTAKGKEDLRDEIRDTVNSFLTQGRIKQVLFTDFIYS